MNASRYSLLAFLALLVVLAMACADSETIVEGQTVSSGLDLGDQVLLDIDLDEAEVTCEDDQPFIVVRASEPLPAGAVIAIVWSRLPPQGADAREYDPVGEPQRILVPVEANAVRARLAAEIVPGTEDLLFVYVSAIDSDGGSRQSKSVDADTSALDECRPEA